MSIYIISSINLYPSFIHHLSIIYPSCIQHLKMILPLNAPRITHGLRQGTALRCWDLRCHPPGSRGSRISGWTSINGGFHKWRYHKMDGLQRKIMKIPWKWMISGCRNFQETSINPSDILVWTKGFWTHPHIYAVFTLYSNFIAQTGSINPILSIYSSKNLVKTQFYDRVRPFYGEYTIHTGTPRDQMRGWMMLQ